MSLSGHISPSEYIALCVLLLIMGTIVGVFFLLKKVVGPPLAWTFLAVAVGGFVLFAAYAELLGDSVTGEPAPHYRPAAYTHPLSACTPGEGSCRQT